MLCVSQGIRTSVSGNLAAWRKVQDSHNPHLAMLPEEWGGGGYDGKLGVFQRLLVLRALRPDKLVPGIVSYVIDIMGKEYVEPQVGNFPHLPRPLTPPYTHFGLTRD